jgi:hypothetical protein
LGDHLRHGRIVARVRRKAAALPVSPTETGGATPSLRGPGSSGTRCRTTGASGAPRLIDRPATVNRLALRKLRPATNSQGFP